IVAARGATLDVSGATDLLDVHPMYLGMNAYADGRIAVPMVPATSGLTTPLFQSLAVPTQLDSNGGTITLKGSQALFVDATLLGEAGGPSALGGTLSISSGRFYPANTAKTTADINLVVTQSGLSIPIPFEPGTSAIGKAVLDGGGVAIPAMGYFAADTFLRGGFDALTLGGNVQFSGPVNIAARRYLKVATGGIIQADSAVTLAAPYVALGKPFVAPLQPQQTNWLFTQTDKAGTTTEHFPIPTFGAGSLTVQADLIDVGTLSLTGIGRASLTSTGDIRGNGYFNIAGDLFLQAGQIYPTTAGTFAITAFDYVSGGANKTGSVTIAGSAPRNAPLSAGGTLQIFGSTITHGGTLVAPIGSIQLGWDGTGTAPVNRLTNGNVPVTQQLTLLSGSVTSVAGIDHVTGAELLLPYGFNSDGNTWVDPFGVDITASGVASKSIVLSAANLTAEAGSVVDARGGGDLFAYRWVAGNGGSQDILASSGSFAVLRNFEANFAPYAPFNSSLDDANLASGEEGYVNSTLSVGDRIYLSGSPTLPAGYYTLLPARYALIPGARLVTPQSGTPIGRFTKDDGSQLVSGFLVNDLNSERTLNPLFSRFEVAPATTFLQRATYETSYANTFLKAGAEAVDAKVPRLPLDGGYVLFQGVSSMRLDGEVYARGASSGGRGGLIDIDTPLDIVIDSSGSSGGAGVLALSASRLSNYGAESLLIGGKRTFGDTSTAVQVRAGSITVNNAGAPLSGPEIILAANRGITLAPGATIEQSGTITSADALVVSASLSLSTIGQSLTFERGGTAISFPNGTPGNNRITSTVGGFITPAGGGTPTALTAGVPTALSVGSTVTLSAGGTISFASGTGGAIPVSIGDGALVRVSGDPNASTSRTAVAFWNQPTLSIGPGATLSGTSLTLDSTFAFTLDPAAKIDGDYVNLNSGQISMQFTNPGALQPTVGLVLTEGALQNFASTKALSLLSYSSIDLYGFGSFTAEGEFALHASSFRGFNQGGGTVSLNAEAITIDNSANVSALPGLAAATGALQFNAESLTIGANPVRMDQFTNVELNATSELLFTGSGGLTVQNAATVNTPLITAARSATQSLTAGGALNLLGGGTGT
ncbi:MAG: hypothetical protein ACOYMN_16735, partial [Roseimicrobium sp.]